MGALAAALFSPRSTCAARKGAALHRRQAAGPMQKQAREHCGTSLLPIRGCAHAAEPSAPARPLRAMAAPAAAFAACLAEKALNKSVENNLVGLADMQHESEIHAAGLLLVLAGKRAQMPATSLKSASPLGWSIPQYSLARSIIRTLILSG